MEERERREFMERHSLSESSSAPGGWKAPLADQLREKGWAKRGALTDSRWVRQILAASAITPNAHKWQVLIDQPRYALYVCEEIRAYFEYEQRA